MKVFIFKKGDKEIPIKAENETDARVQLLDRLEKGDSILNWTLSGAQG